MVKYRLFLILILLYFPLSWCVYGQAPDTAVPKMKELPYIQHFSPADFGGHRQSWSFLQDHRGVLYVGNTNGLITYDGVNWHLHSGIIKSMVRSLSLANEGRVLYGARDDFGYLRSDSLGQIEAVSLRRMLPKEIDDVKDVWEVRHLNGKYYFQTYEYLFSFDQHFEIADEKMQTDGGISIWKAEKQFQGLSVVRDTLYLWEEKSGLKYMTADSLQPVPGGEIFTESSVTRILPIPDRTSGLLVTTLASGLFACDQGECKSMKIPAPLNEGSSGLRILNADLLSNGDLALATGRNGLVILDKEGHLVQQLDNTTGLNSNNIEAIYSDKQRGLWLASSNNLSRLELPAPISVFKAEPGFSGSIICFEQHQGQLYIGTREGVLRKTTGKVEEFEKIEGFNGAAFSLLSTGKTLLAAFPYSGVYELKNNALIKIVDRGVPIQLIQSRYDPNLIFVGRGETNRGFSMLYQTDTGGKKWLPWAR